jgi:hypothetical protein
MCSSVVVEFVGHRSRKELWPPSGERHQNRSTATESMLTERKDTVSHIALTKLWLPLRVSSACSGYKTSAPMRQKRVDSEFRDTIHLFSIHALPATKLGSSDCGRQARRKPRERVWDPAALRAAVSFRLLRWISCRNSMPSLLELDTKI